MSANKKTEELIVAAFNDESLRELARAGLARRYPKNSILINEGDSGSSLILILTGRLRVFSMNDGGQEFVHGIYGPGDYVGEMSLDGQARSAYVKTLDASVCVTVQREQIITHIQTYPEFAMDLLTRVIGRARIATHHAKTLALTDSYGRIAHLLNELAEELDDGSRIIPERLTHKEIASRVGSSREMVSRILKDLTNGGFLCKQDDRYHLKRRLPPGW